MLSYIDVFWLLPLIFGARVPVVSLMRNPNPGAAPPPAH
jgi:hypothetical protein